MYQRRDCGTHRTKRVVAPEGQHERGRNVGARHEGTGSSADRTGEPVIQVVRAADWLGVVEQVVEVGGRVLCVHAESVLVVELPPGVTAAAVGADEVEERRRTRSPHGVTATWRPVATAC